MQENRSFDHYFGTLAGVRGFDDPNAMNLPNGKSVFLSARSGEPERLSAAVPSGHAQHQRAERFPPPAMPGPCSTRAWNGGEDGQLAARPPQGRGRQGAVRDGLPHARRYSVSVRAGRGVHHLRRLSLLGDGPDLAQPHVLDDRHHRSRRRARRPDDQQQARSTAASAGRPTPSGWRRPASVGRSISRRTTTAATCWRTSRRFRNADRDSPLSYNRA